MLYVCNIVKTKQKNMNLMWNVIQRSFYENALEKQYSLQLSVER